MIFITFECCEGAQKTALIDAVEMYLFSRDYNVLRGRLPNFAFNLSKSSVFDDPQTTKRFWKTTRQQIDNIPECTILLQDRWAESVYVYQGLVGATSDGELRDHIYKRARQMTAPDLTVFLPITPQRAAQRVAARDNKAADIEHLTKIIAAYDRIYCAGMGIWDQRVYRPSGHATFDEIVENVADLIIDTWKEKYGSQ